MQTIKPRAIHDPESNSWIVHGAGIVKNRTCINEALAAWRQRFVDRQIGPRVEKVEGRAQ